MVNLVVRQGHHLQTTGTTNITTPNPTNLSQSISNSPVGQNRMIGVTGAPSHIPKPERYVPSPIRVPAFQSNRRSVSPLTTSDSMFGTVVIPELEQDRSPMSDHSSSRQDRSFGVRVDPGSSRESSMGDSQGEIVCDYDHNVTPLYELLESSQWDMARLRCRTHAEEVQTWIVRRDANNNIRWKLLPLHAAVIFQAPSTVIESMLKEYPLAAGKRDDQGMLPLHLAFRHKQDESMLELLLSQYPKAVAVKDRRGRLPLDHGKETQFSAGFLQKFAEAYTKGHRGRLASDSPGISAEFETKHVKELQEVKATYEERLESLAQQHEQELRDLKLKMESEHHIARVQHNQEMDELRDLLSREVASAQRTRQMGEEIQALQASLSKANDQTKALRDVVHAQKLYEEEMKKTVQQLLDDHKTLQDYCEQQQQQIEQSQQLREQLLRSLLQKEDGAALQTSREISQLAEDIRNRTEKFLSQASSSTLNVSAAVAAAADRENIPPALPTPMKTATSSSYDERAAEWTAHQVGDNDHEDDISAITDDHF